MPEVSETYPSTCESSGSAGLMDRCVLYEGEKGLLNVPQLKVQHSIGQVAETSLPQLNRQEIQHATSSSLYI
jgi:hypothetical protein